MAKPVGRRTVLASLGAGFVGVAGVTGCHILPGERVPEPTANPAFGPVPQRGTLELSSPAKQPNGRLPTEYGHLFANENPPLVIGGVPDRARTLALVMDGPDVPGGEFTYWLVWNIPTDRHRIPRDWQPSDPVTLGANSSGSSDIGYFGPSPPNRQTFRFKLFALDTTLDLPSGASKRALGDAIEGHILAQTQLAVWYDFHSPAHDSISGRGHVTLVDDLCFRVLDHLSV